MRFIGQRCDGKFVFAESVALHMLDSPPVSDCYLHKVLVSILTGSPMPLSPLLLAAVPNPSTTVAQVLPIIPHADKNALFGSLGEFAFGWFPLIVPLTHPYPLSAFSSAPFAFSAFIMAQ